MYSRNIIKKEVPWKTKEKVSKIKKNKKVTQKIPIQNLDKYID